MTTNLKTSLLVNRQVPEFVREEYPLFISFLEAYYEYLETKQGSELNDLTTKAKDLKDIADVDRSIDDFEDQFFNTYATLLPKDVQVDKEFLIKNVLPLYLAKGNEKAFKLLFRMLFNDEVDILLPKNNVLRASDGKWTVDNILKVETDVRSVYTGNGSETTFILAQEVIATEITVYVDDVEQTVDTDFYIRKETKKLIFHSAPSNGSEIKVVYSNFDISLLANRQVTGVTSGATAIVERAQKRIITDTVNLGFPFELFINSKTLSGSFEQGEEVTTNIFDTNGDLITIKADTFSIVNKINVINAGASYNVGDPVLLTGGGAAVSGTARISDVEEGYIDKITVIRGGAGFQDAGDIIVANTPGLLLDLVIDGVDTTGTANSTQNTYSVYTDVIGDYANVTISDSDYGFPSTVVPTGENVNTIISQALSPLELTNLGPITNVFVLFSNAATTISPTLDAVGAEYTLGNTTFSIKTFKSIGKIQINDGGEGYEIGDEIIFGTNPIGTNGIGAAAAVKNVSDTGAITEVEIQASRISGTANVTNNAVEIVGTGTSFDTELNLGDKIIINNQTRYINAINSSTQANVNVNFTMTNSISTVSNRGIGKYGTYPIGGQQYTQGLFPDLTVSSNNASATGANVEVSALMGDGEELTPFIGNVQPGEIISIQVVSGGSGYQYIPTVDLSGYGDGTATANAEIESGYISLPGRWITSDSILSTSERRLQGRDYYVDYSYVTSSLTEFSKYKTILKDLLHPSGFVNYADLNRISSLTPDTITISTNTETTIAGTVNVETGSIYVVGTNTGFNVANTNGVLTIGSNVSVNGEIRTVDSIISNTNLAVTSAFTTTANANTLIILT